MHNDFINMHNFFVKMYAMNRITNKLIGLVLVLSGLLMFLLLTDPSKIHISLLLVPFGLIALAVFLITNIFFSDLFRLNKRMSLANSVIFAFIVVILLSLSSLRQLTPRDIFLTVLFGVVFAWYFGRFKNR